MANATDDVNSPRPEDHILEVKGAEKDCAGIASQHTVQPSARGVSSGDGVVNGKIEGGTPRSASQNAGQNAELPKEKAKPSKMNAIWAKLDLDTPTLITMFK